VGLEVVEVEWLLVEVLVLVGCSEPVVLVKELLVRVGLILQVQI